MTIVIIWSNNVFSISSLCSKTSWDSDTIVALNICGVDPPSPASIICTRDWSESVHSSILWQFKNKINKIIDIKNQQKQPSLWLRTKQKDIDTWSEMVNSPIRSRTSKAACRASSPTSFVASITSASTSSTNSWSLLGCAKKRKRKRLLMLETNGGKNIIKRAN